MKGNNIPEKYKELISFRGDVGENGRYVVRHIPVVMLFNYMDTGFTLEWISDNFSMTVEELEKVQDFIRYRIPIDTQTERGVTYRLLIEYMLDGYSPDWITENLPVTKQELQKAHAFIEERI